MVKDQITVLQPHFLENKKALKRSSATGKTPRFLCPTNIAYS